MSLQITAKATLLTATNKPYSFDNDGGKKVEGVSYVLRFNIEGEIFPFKVTKEVYELYANKLKTEGDITFSITSFKEKIGFSLDKFLA